MRLLSHRGLWKTVEDKNSKIAFVRSFKSGFGTEVDVRDCSGDLVISHDPPEGQCLKFEDFLAVYKEFGEGLPLALNIKSDGLQKKLKSALRSFEIENFFVFDMSIPDMVLYLMDGFPTFTRQSEFEPVATLLKRVQGVWIDCFERNWYTHETILDHLKAGKAVSIVSPELHGRDAKPMWEMLVSWDDCCIDENMMLCTDYIDEAKLFFEQYL